MQWWNFDVLINMVKKINPVTWLSSTASCSLLEAVKLNSGISQITAERPLHFSASSINHKISFSFLSVMKIILSGAIPNAFSAGRKMFLLLLTQMAAPLFFISDEMMPVINPQEADASSIVAAMNSCTAPIGNVRLEKHF